MGIWGISVLAHCNFILFILLSYGFFLNAKNV